MAGFKEKWAGFTKAERQHLLSHYIVSPTLDETFLDLVRADEGWGVYASTGANYRYAIFGRDSIETAEDLLEAHEELASEIIVSTARLQGLKTDSRNEEEPGKIHHEYRSAHFNGGRVPPASFERMRQLQWQWGEDGDDMVYYGTVDATPLYLRLLGNFAARYGEYVWQLQYIGRDRTQRSVLDSAYMAAEWIARKISSSPWGFIEYKRQNPHGLANQAWKDSQTAYLHTNGEPANYDSGIAALEVQGYAYDALKVAAALPGISPERSAHYLQLAKSLQQAVLSKLWMPQEQFFAQGLDRDGQGKSRQIRTLTSNAGLLLDSKLLLDLPEESRRHYTQPVIEQLQGREFLTGAGIRCRALKHKAIPGYVDYHGSYAVWPKETYDIAKGARRHGYETFAAQLERYIVESVIASGEFYELFYVGDHGDIWYDRHAAVSRFSSQVHHQAPPVPETGQAWVISAFMSIAFRRQAHLVSTGNGSLAAA